MHPLLAVTLGMVGAVALVRWCMKEVQRVNTELDRLPRRARDGDRAAPAHRR